MKAVFLDRDGTVVEERGYLTTPEMIALLPGAARAIADLRARGWKAIIVSNQALVAKGMITEEELAAINLRMVSLLAAEGAALDGIYCCPHHPEHSGECDCRKPRPGMLERAAREHGLELAECVLVGDTRRDIDAGKAAGAATVLVLTGKGAATSAEPHGADHVAKDLAAAAEWLVRRGSERDP